MRWILLIGFAIVISGCTNPVAVKEQPPAPIASVIGQDGTKLVKVRGRLHQEKDGQVRLCQTITPSRGCGGPFLIVIGFVGDEEITWQEARGINVSAPVVLQGYVSKRTMRLRQIVIS